MRCAKEMKQYQGSVKTTGVTVIEFQMCGGREELRMCGPFYKLM